MHLRWTWNRQRLLLLWLSLRTLVRLSLPLDLNLLNALGRRLRLDDQSDLGKKDLLHLALEDERMSPALRLILQQPIQRKVKGVIFSQPGTPQGQVLFNLVRHVLELRAMTGAATIDLQRLQMCSQINAVVRVSCRCPYFL